MSAYPLFSLSVVALEKSSINWGGIFLVDITWQLIIFLLNEDIIWIILFFYWIVHEIMAGHRLFLWQQMWTPHILLLWYMICITLLNTINDYSIKKILTILWQNFVIPKLLNYRFYLIISIKFILQKILKKCWFYKINSIKYHI